MSAFTIGLGDEVEDIVSGFRGLVTGRVEYLTGCRQYLVNARLEKGQQDTKTGWFDEDRLKVRKGGALKVAVRNDGFGEQPPTPGRTT